MVPPHGLSDLERGLKTLVTDPLLVFSCLNLTCMNRDYNNKCVQL